PDVDEAPARALLPGLPPAAGAPAPPAALSVAAVCTALAPPLPCEAVANDAAAAASAPAAPALDPLVDARLPPARAPPVTPAAESPDDDAPASLEARSLACPCPTPPWLSAAPACDATALSALPDVAAFGGAPGVLFARRFGVSLPANVGSPDNEPRWVALVEQPTRSAAISSGARLMQVARNVPTGTAPSRPRVEVSFVMC